jgi:2-polyprenyl-3-methyl-5-hydroxy-6-metoxy-1,4-benzoquinol methylase
MVEVSPDPDRVYALGHSAWELARLNRQAALVDPITRHLFVDAGLVSGMRVLDLGSGSGAVSMLVAQIVGPRGSVTGYDLSPVAVETATLRVRAAGFENVAFRLGNPLDAIADERFDAVVGRYVLMFLHDPAAMLRHLSAHLVPGGIVAFHEPCWDREQWSVNVPHYDRCARWCAQGLAAQGANVRMGFDLYSCFLQAGLSAPTQSLAAGFGGGEQGRDWAIMVVDLLQTMRPDIVRLGIATEAEVDIEQLLAEIGSELSRPDALVFGRSEIGAWARRCCDGMA